MALGLRVRKASRARAPDSPVPGEYMDVQTARPTKKLGFRPRAVRQVMGFPLLEILIPNLKSLQRRDGFALISAREGLLLSNGDSRHRSGAVKVAD